jgi:L-aspartate oxidase
MSRAHPIIIGTGIAGLWTAWRLAAEGVGSVLISKERLRDSASAWAQGGIAVALGPGDSPTLHARDTLAAGDGLSDPDAVRVLTTEGPDRIRELLALGAVFDRAPDGTLRFGLEAAHSLPRIIHSGGDRTGAAIVAFLTDIVRALPEIEIREHTEALALHHDSWRVTGVIVSREGQVETLEAPDVVLATGGVGQLYSVTTNPLVATGDGWALAWRGGAELRDLEFLQFHPTALKLPGLNPAPLITEAIRGAGGILVDREGRRFCFDADPRGELAPRDVVSRAVAAADATGGAWLDARDIPDFPIRFPGVSGILTAHGLDPMRHLIPVAPALHYAMGGVRTDLDGRTTRERLWAVGEVACTGVHGANRLASNSLLEGLVFADRVARALAQGRVAEGIGGRWMAEARQYPVPRGAPGTPSLDPEAEALAEPIRNEMRQIMTTDVGLVRTELGLLRAKRRLGRLARATPPGAWKTASQLLVARLITQAARRRRESRGGHRRLDFPPIARVGATGGTAA